MNQAQYNESNTNSQRKFTSLSRIHFLVEFNKEKGKLFLVFTLFLFFALTSVVTQIVLPEILDLSGIEIIGLPEPSLMAMLSDFWGDTIIYLIIVIFYGMGTFSSEIEINKPIYFTLSRPVTRKTYFLSRFLIRIIGFFLIFFTASMIIYILGSLYFSPLKVERVILASMILALSLTGILSIIIMASSRFRTMTSAVIGFGFVVYHIFLLLLEKPFEWIKWFDPLLLSNIWFETLNGVANSVEFVVYLIALLFWIILPGLIGLLLFENRDI